jgi:dihydrofolate synthase/folylpolyglutamate synthase
VADALLDALAKAGIADVPADARREGYSSARWPGRLELLDIGGREVLLDGAHNPAGAAALATAFDDLRPFLAGPGPASTSPVLVLGLMADKDVAGVVRGLASSPHLRTARVVATSVGLERALAPADLAAAWRAVVPDASVRVVEGVDAAIEAALDAATGPPAPIVVAGSLYLVGAVRAALLDDPDLRDPEPRS